MRPGSARRVPNSVPVKNRSFFGVPRGARERAEAINFDADSPPRSEKSSFCCTAGSRRPVGAIFRRCLSIFCFFAKCEMSIPCHACWQKQRFGPSRCESSRSRAATSKNTKIGPKIDPKSWKIASWGRSGGLLGRLLSLEAPWSSSPERLGSPGCVALVARAARGYSNRRATRAERPGSTGCVALVARAGRQRS